MKKSVYIIITLCISLLFCGAGYWLYKTSSPEYALKQTIDDIQANGTEGLKEHLTDDLRGTVEVLQEIAENPLVSLVISTLDADDTLVYLLSEIRETQWSVDDAMRSRDKAEAVLRYNCRDQLIGTIPIRMIRENGQWKISGIGIPRIESVFSSFQNDKRHSSPQSYAAFLISLLYISL